MAYLFLLLCDATGQEFDVDCTPLLDSVQPAPYLCSMTLPVQWLAPISRLNILVHGCDEVIQKVRYCAAFRDFLHLLQCKELGSQTLADAIYKCFVPL